MINKLLLKLLMLLIFMNLTSCLKSPVDDQVKLEAGVVGSLEVVGSFNRGISPVNTIDSFFIYLKNNGKLPIKILNFHFDNPTVVSFIEGKYPGLNGDCAEELKANESCRLSLQAFGNKTIEFNDYFWIDYLNGVKEQRFHAKIFGAFGVPAKLEFIGPLFHDFGLIEPGVEKKTVLTLKNNGELTAKSIQGFINNEENSNGVFYFTGLNKKFPGENGTCKDSLIQFETCTIEIATKPLVSGNIFKSKIAVTFMNPSVNQTINTSVQVEAADFKAYLSVVEKSQNLGNLLNGVSLNDSPEVVFTLVNYGYAAASEVNLINTSLLPFVLKSSTCEGVLPGSSCQMIYKVQSNYSTQLPSPTNFPIQFFEKGISFSYKDGKFPALAYTEEVIVSLKILGEAYLNIYKNADIANPFDLNHNLITNNVVWSRSDWNTSIGSSTISQHQIKFANSRAGATVDATNITFEVIGTNNEIKVRCKEELTCMKKMGAGASDITYIDHYPVYVEPFIEDVDYVVRISYYSGLETKSINIKIETKKIADPIIKILTSAGNELTATTELEKTIGNREVEGTFSIKNNGPLPYVFDLDTLEVANASHFSIPDASNECLNTTIKNGQVCNFKIKFYKNNYEGSFPNYEVHTLKLKFTNGLSPSNPKFKSFENVIKGIILSPRAFKNDPNAKIDFQSKPWSRPGMTDKYFEQFFTLEKIGDWKISQHTIDIEGVDKSLFSIVSVSKSLNDDVAESRESTISVLIRLTSPNENLSVPRLLNAKLVVKYYGKKEEDFAGFASEDKIEIPILAKIQNEPFVTVALQTGFLQTRLNETSVGVIKIENTGQTSLAGANQLKILLKEENSNFFKYDLSSSANTCTNLSMVTEPGVPPFFVLSSDLLVGESCLIAIAFTPESSGSKNAYLYLDYKYSSNEKAAGGLVLSGSGAVPGTADISPMFDSYIQDYFSFGNNELGASRTLSFTVRNNSGTYGNPIIVDSVSMVGMSATGDCRFSAKLSSVWKDYNQVSNVLDYSVSSNSCANKRIANIISVEEGEVTPPLDGIESCSLDINFNASIPNRLIGSCLEINYRSVETPAINRKRIMKFLGYGIPPIADFNGWVKMVSNGETNNSFSENVLEWKPMTVSLPSALIVGYNIYRKQVSDNEYPNKPLNSTEISIANNRGNFEYHDVHEDELNPLNELFVYNYEIRAVVKFNGIGGEYELSTNGADRTLKIVQAPAYTVFFPRSFLNKLVCVDTLGLDYSALNRNNNYNCSYTGYGSSGGLYDFGKGIIVDMYENSYVDGRPSNLPGYQPRLYNNLSDAKTSCSMQNVSIPKLNILSTSKRLINRQEYMIASIGQKNLECNIENSLLSNSGESKCVSDFKIENMIGNAWDFLDAQMIKTSSGNKWNYSESIFTGNRQYPVPIRTLNFDSIVFSDYNTYYQFNTFNDSYKCYQPILGMPLLDVAGSCPGGSILTSTYKSKMNLSLDHTHIQVIDDSSEIFTTEEGFRLLFAGGSYKSKPVFGVEPNRHTMYWTNPYVETILTQGAPDSRARWEGGAARCVIDIPN